MDNDEYPWSRLPEVMRPQLLMQAAKPPTGNWQYEIKFDGYRFLARVGEQVRLFTKNGHDWTSRLPALADELTHIPGCAWVDGEVVALDASGQPSFHALQQAFATGKTEHVVFYAFDLMYLNCTDLRPAPLEQRRALLAGLLAGGDYRRIRLSETLDVDPSTLLDTACHMKLEGIVAKRLGSRYSEKRSPDWVKVKCNNREAFKIAGYTRAGTGIGSIIIGTFSEGDLVYSGRIQSGLTDRISGRILKLASSLRAEHCPFQAVPRSLAAHDVIWVRPELECRIKYTEVTPTGRVRHGVLVALECKPKPGSTSGEATA